MPLEAYQFEMELDKIYELQQFQDLDNFRPPNLFVKGGSVDVYASEELPASKAEMALEDSAVTGHNPFNTFPKYMYLEENAATVSSIIITGIKPTEVV